MNVEEVRNYCISLKGAAESFPFDDVTLVFKVGGKMFALLSLNKPLAIGLKCDPVKAIELRELYPCVTPGHHLNKKHWNNVKIDGSVKPSIIKGWIDDSYILILESLSKIKRNTILNQ
jgi:predicted DNA-binding protein (MmcQ/YjbR family)